jgi:hypothetical protein
MPRRTTRFAVSAALTLSTMLAAFGPLAGPAAATAPAEWPGNAGLWPVCADAGSRYCIEEATVTPAGGEPAPAAELGLTATARILDGMVTSFNWAIEGWDDAEVSDDVRAGDVRFVIRVGRFAPRYTMAIAEGMRIQRDTDDAGDTTMIITGKATHIDWTTGELFASCINGGTCGTEDQMADVTGSGHRFSGNTQDLETWGEEYIGRLDGMYIASDAQARPTVVLFGTWPEPYWTMQALGNPHLDMNGNPVRGSFNAWLPPAYFTSMDTTPEAAAAVGFDVVSSENGSSVSIPAQVGEVDGGVAIDVPDLGYSIHSINVVGRASAATEGATVPGTPGGVAATPVNGSLRASWNAPASDGGLGVTGYTVRAWTAATAGTVAGRCTATTGTTCTMHGLVVGRTYHLAVSAKNALGEGAASARVAGVPATAPSAPGSVTLTPGNGRLTATWPAPIGTGGSPVTGYTASAYTAASGGTAVRSCTSTAVARRCDLTGLANGTRYYVDVRSANAAGTGFAGISRAEGTPRTVATAPRSVKVTSTGGKLVAAWTAPAATGGTPVTGYKVEAWTAAKGGSVAARCTTAGTGKSCRTPGVKIGATYYVSVTALNAAGTSPASARVKVTAKR